MESSWRQFLRFESDFHQKFARGSSGELLGGCFVLIWIQNEILRKIVWQAPGDFPLGYTIGDQETYRSKNYRCTMLHKVGLCNGMAAQSLVEVPGLEDHFVQVVPFCKDFVTFDRESHNLLWLRGAESPASSPHTQPPNSPPSPNISTQTTPQATPHTPANTEANHNHTGQDRTTQDRTGQDWTGQDRIGLGRTGGLNRTG